MIRPRQIACVLATLVLVPGCSEITTPADPPGDALAGPSEVASPEPAAASHRLEIELLGALTLDSQGPYEALADVPVELLEIVPIPPEDQVTDSTGVRAKVEFVPKDTVVTGADGTVGFDVAPGEYGVELETRCHGSAYVYAPTTEGDTTRYELRLQLRWQPGALLPEGC